MTLLDFKPTDDEIEYLISMIYGQGASLAGVITPEVTEDYIGVIYDSRAKLAVDLAELVVKESRVRNSSNFVVNCVMNMFTTNSAITLIQDCSNESRAALIKKSFIMGEHLEAEFNLRKLEYDNL